jgi:hypothetical protein
MLKGKIELFDYSKFKQILLRAIETASSKGLTEFSFKIDHFNDTKSKGIYLSQKDIVILNIK